MYGGYYPYYGGAMPDSLGQLRSQPQTAPQSGMLWVQGENAAKSYAVAPNTSVVLFDTENNSFYIKTSDASGMPMPLRVFDYQERSQNSSNLPTVAVAGGATVDLSNYVTFDYLNEMLENMGQNIAPKKEKKTKGENENA